MFPGSYDFSNWPGSEAGMRKEGQEGVVMSRWRRKEW